MLGATGVPMAMRRCSYTAAFKLKLVEYAERHGNRCARSPESSLSQCGECAYKSVYDRPKVQVQLILRATYTPENTVSISALCCTGASPN